MRRTTFFLLALLSPLAAQSDRATLTGTVADQTQGSITGATITIRATATGLEQTTVSSAAGAYTLSFLPVGQYTMSVAAQGFDAVRIEPFPLNAGQTRTLNIMMKIGAVSSEVTVVAATPDLDQTSAEIGGVIQGSQTQALPVNGRYWATLMALIPGAIDSGSGTQDQIRFAGLSQEDNNFRFDGVDATGINHQFQKEPARLQFSTESIAEFRASSAVYSADVGGSPGG
jgi:hypothetical protein